MSGELLKILMDDRKAAQTAGMIINFFMPPTLALGRSEQNKRIVCGEAKTFLSAENFRWFSENEVLTISLSSFRSATLAMGRIHPRTILQRMQSMERSSGGNRRLCPVE